MLMLTRGFNKLNQNLSNNKNKIIGKECIFLYCSVHLTVINRLISGRPASEMAV